ncbi:DUF2510 domain-containing protein, partial [Herbiconiux sp. CPCC 203406]
PAAAVAAPLMRAPQAPYAPQTPHAPQGPPLGWYPAPGDVLRWWDGRRWTGLRVKNGVPGSDWATTEQPGAAWAFGGIFLGLAALQFLLGALGSIVSPNGIATLALAALWFAIAAQSQAVRRIPAPTGDAVVIDAVRPLPGEEEGPGAGWFPVAPRFTRWWTGTRWSQYTGTIYGVRPSFQGARAYRVLLIMSWILVGLGVLALLAGIILLVVAADSLWAAIGVIVIIGGVLIAVLGLVILLLTRYQRRILLLPTDPPQNKAPASHGQGIGAP